MKTINDYAELVKEKHALNKTIAPVETDLTDASRGYHIGEQFIIDGGLFKAKTEIAQHDALVLNTNYEPADNLTEQIKNAGGGTGTDPRLDVFEKNIAPVETDETDASKEYQVGEQLILNNILYDVIAPISEHDVITTTGSGANIEPAGSISSGIQTLTNKLDNEIVTRSALGAKNILPFVLADIKALNTNGTWAGNVYTYRGVDFTVNSDGTISATGTAIGGNASIKLFAASSNYEMLGKNVILNGCPSGGSATTYRIQAYRMGSVDGSSGTYFDDGDGTIAFDALNDASGTVGSFAVAVYENATVTNLLFKPMVRLASDSDAIYQPYAKTNRELTVENQTLTNEVSDISDEIADMNNVLGAKNLLPNKATSQTVNDVTFTVNSDGSVTANGTAIANTAFIINSTFRPKSGTYIISGQGLSNATNMVLAIDAHNGTTYVERLTLLTKSKEHDNIDVDYDGYDTIRVFLYVESGKTETNLNVKPMIRPASIQDDTYVPYSMTNREMTPYVQAISNPNLLDNPWFTVNQRGQSTYSGAVYGVDRWQSYEANNVQTVNSEGVLVTRQIAQVIDADVISKILDKNVTISMLYNNGKILKATGKIHSDVSSTVDIGAEETGVVNIIVYDFVFGDNQHSYSLQINVVGNDAVQVKAVKLELGEVSTLVSDTAQNYQQELAKCKYYYQRLAFSQDVTICQAWVAKNWVGMNLPVGEMRAVPVKTITGNINAVSSEDISFDYANGNVAQIAGGYTISGARTTNGTFVEGYFAGGTGGVVIELSADL